MFKDWRFKKLSRRTIPVLWRNLLWAYRPLYAYLRLPGYDHCSGGTQIRSLRNWFRFYFIIALHNALAKGQFER